MHFSFIVYNGEHFLFIGSKACLFFCNRCVIISQIINDYILRCCFYLSKTVLISTQIFHYWPHSLFFIFIPVFKCQLNSSSYFFIASYILHFPILLWLFVSGNHDKYYKFEGRFFTFSRFLPYIPFAHLLQTRP